MYGFEVRAEKADEGRGFDTGAGDSEKQLDGEVEHEVVSGHGIRWREASHRASKNLLLSWHARTTDLLEEASSHVALALAVSPSMLLKPASSLVFLSPSQIDVLDQTLLAQAGALTEARLRQSRLQGEHGTGATWRRLQDMWAALEAVPEPRRDLESKEAAVVELGEAIEAAVERVLGATHEPASSLNLSIDMLLWPTEELARLAPRQLAALTRLVEAQRAVLQATRVSQARHQERAAAGDEQIRKTEIAKLKVEQALAQSLEEPGRL